MGNAHRPIALLGLLVPVLRIPSRTPLLHRGSLLQPAAPSLRFAPVFRRDPLEAGDLPHVVPSLDLRQPEAPHRLAFGRIELRSDLRRSLPKRLGASGRKRRLLRTIALWTSPKISTG